MRESSAVEGKISYAAFCKCAVAAARVRACSARRVPTCCACTARARTHLPPRTSWPESSPKKGTPARRG
eukprot:4598406-Prymnesium_polylepis.1